jgi:hypothetical protein
MINDNKKEPQENGKKMSFDRRALMSISSQSKLYSSVENEPLKDTAEFFALLCAFHALTVSLMILLVNKFMSGILFGMLYFRFTSMIVIAMIMGLFFCFFFGSFALAACYHVFAYILGARKPFSNTYKSFAYSASPAMLFAWIPVVGFLLYMWVIYANVASLSYFQGIGKAKAAAAIFIPIIILSGIASAVLIFYTMQYFASFNLGQFSGLGIF